jgi:hypothetical protein
MRGGGADLRAVLALVLGQDLPGLLAFSRCAA